MMKLVKARFLALLLVAVASVFVHPSAAICAVIADAPENLSLWWCPGPVGDDNPCTIDICLPFFGTFYIPRSQGTTCAAGNVCEGTASCDGAGTCVAGAPLAVDDDNPCTVDSCDAEFGVRHEALADGSACESDGNACTSDSCFEGMCEHAAIACDDGNGCTTDLCDALLGCMAVAEVGAPCDDGDACSVGDACDENGQCASGGSLNCDDGAFCNGVETCDSASGCVAGAPPMVDDGVDCTEDRCDEVADLVVHAPLDVLCDDGDSCDGVDHCDATLGCQVSGPFTCDLAIVSDPVTSVLVGSWSLPPEAVDLRPFTVTDVPIAQSRWTIASDGTSAQQNAKTFWSYLVADRDSVSEKFEADLHVPPGYAGHNFLGLGFGYQDPNHTYVLQWKAASGTLDGQSTLRGLSVRAIVNTDNSPKHYSLAGGYLGTQELYFNDIGPWYQNEVDHFSIDFDPGVFTISVSRGATTFDTATIEDATYLTGRFAFFTYEQAVVVFRNVRRTVHAHADYVYTVEVAGIDAGEHATFSMVTGPFGMTIDADTGRVFWQMSARSVGLHPVTVRASDGTGATVDQSFTLEVVDAGPCYDAPATLPCGP